MHSWSPAPVATKAGSRYRCDPAVTVNRQRCLMEGSRSINSSMYCVKHTPGSCSYDTVLSRLALTASLAVQRRYQHNHQNSLHVHLCCLLTNLGQCTAEDVVLFSPHLRITFAVRGTLQHVNIAHRSHAIIRARAFNK